MTDNQLPAPRPRPSSEASAASGRRRTLGSRPGFWPTAALAGACFLLLFEFLAYQLRHGNDPALGGITEAAPAKPPRPVLVRRVVKTRVVQDPAAVSGGQLVSSSGGGSTSTASPAPAAAPAPAPAPAAPVVSSSS
jgi:hypothetical protein